MPERLRRSIVPSTIIRLSTIDRPARAAAALTRARGKRGAVELFFAFDDPCSAVAVIDLAERLAGRDVDLVLSSVVERGIPGDPAVEAKRRFAVEDARRLARRSGRTLGRSEPIDPAVTAPLAEHAMTLSGAARLAFCRHAVERLWMDGEEVRAHGSRDEDAVRRNERRMRRRGPYDTPAAVIGRDWYFAHDRLAQIGERLDDLGWRRSA